MSKVPRGSERMAWTLTTGSPIPSTSASGAEVAGRLDRRHVCAGTSWAHNRRACGPHTRDGCLTRTRNGSIHDHLVAALGNEFNLSIEDSELAIDRVQGEVVRAQTGNEANRPDRAKNPIAWTSFERSRER